MITLNQHIEIFENFAKRHKAIKSFFFGQKPDVGSEEALQYPLLAVYLEPSKLDNSGVVTRSFVADISDRLSKDLSNRTHVLSDTERIAFDLQEYLSQVADSGQLSFVLDSTSEMTDYEDATDDETAGWFFSIKTRTHIGNESCNLPIVNGTIFDGNYINTGGNYNGSCNPVLIKDQNGNIVTTVQPGGIYTIVVLTQTEERFTISAALNQFVVLSNTPQFIYGVYLNGQKLLPENYNIVGSTITILVDFGGEVDVIYQH